MGAPRVCWAALSVGWGGGQRLVFGFSLIIESKPHISRCGLPSQHTFPGSLIPTPEWILAGSTLLYQFARRFHPYGGLPAVPLQSGAAQKAAEMPYR